MPSNAGVVFSYQAEACETRVLLTTTGDDQASETLLNDNEAAYLSPYENEVDDSVQSYVADTGQLSAEADEYTSVINSPVGEFFEPLSEAYGQAMLESAFELASAEDEANSEQQAAETSAGNDASESTTESIDSAFSLFADDPDPAGFASGLLATGTNTSSGDSAGTTAGSTDSSGGGDSDADSAAAAASGPGWTPLQFPANVKFQETSLSAMDESSDWTAFQPTGTSHTTITTTASTAEPVSVSTAGDSTGADGATSVDSDLFASSPANLQTTVTTSEQYNSDSEWTVTQSYTNTFDTTINDWSAENDQAEQSNDDQAQENVNLGVLTRTGIENVTVDIVDGVSRTITYTITDTVSYEVGTLPGEDENTTDEEKWSIPQQWIDSSRQSVNPEEAPEDQDDGPPLMFSNWQADSESTDSGDITAVNWETADTAAEQQNSGSSGGRFRSSNSLTFQVGETLVTMPDGATAKAYTFSFSTSSSMFSKVAGDPGFSLTFGTLTEDPSQGNGIQVGISSSFFFFASASTSTSFTASAVVPDGGSLLDLDISGAFAFAVSFMSGGTTEGSIGLQLQMSSGSTADDSDTHTAFGYSAMTASSGFNHFNFDVSIPFGNQSTTDNTSDSTSNDTSDSDDGDVSELDAEGLVVQLSLGRISSSNSGRTIFYSGKQRLTGEGVISHKTESILVDQSTSSSDQNFEIAVGTEENLIDIGFSGAKSTLVEYAGNADVHEMLGQHKGSESGSGNDRYHALCD